MDISAGIPPHALTQEDTLSLWFKVLPMKQGFKGQVPSFWHNNFLACPEQKGLHVVTCGGGGVWGSSKLWRMPSFFFFPCSPQPMKTLENGTFPSAKPGETVTPGKAWVNTKGKAMEAERGGWGLVVGVLKSLEIFQTCPLWCGSCTYYRPPVLHLG